MARRSHMVGNLVDALAATACQVKRRLVVETAGNEHLAPAVEAAASGELVVVCRKIFERERHGNLLEQKGPQRGPWILVVPTKRLELLTPALRVRCSTS